MFSNVKKFDQANPGMAQRFALHGLWTNYASIRATRTITSQM
jgi:hypothetical protein